ASREDSLERTLGLRRLVLQSPSEASLEDLLQACLLLRGQAACPLRRFSCSHSQRPQISLSVRSLDPRQGIRSQRGQSTVDLAEEIEDRQEPFLQLFRFAVFLSSFLHTNDSRRSIR